MSYQLPPDVVELVQKQIATGRYTTQDEVLREALNALAAEDAEIRAVEEALDRIEDGDPGIRLEDAFAVIRAKYVISGGNVEPA